MSQTAPVWAQRIVATVHATYGPLGCKPPRLEWRRSKVKSHTSGRTWATIDRIVVTAGTDRRHHKWVLLHELAHWLAGPGHQHDETFWDLAYLLYRDYGVYRLATQYESSSLKAAARRARKAA